MKKTIFILSLMLPLVGHSEEMRLSFGMNRPISEIDVFGPSIKDGTTGVGISFDLLFQKLKEGFSIGPSVFFVSRPEVTNYSVFSDADAELAYRSATVGVMLKSLYEISPSPSPAYFVGGFGFSETNVKASIRPINGSVWIDTGTKESRFLVNSKSTSPAFYIGLGKKFSDDGDSSFFTEFGYFRIEKAKIKASEYLFGVSENHTFESLALLFGFQFR